MKLEVLIKHKAELLELDRAISDGCLQFYQSPYFIIKSGNVISQFEFLTRNDYTNKLGRRKYFDMNFKLACPFKTFQMALDIAQKFKNNDSSGMEDFFIIGYAEALIVEKFINERQKGYDL